MSIVVVVVLVSDMWVHTWMPTHISKYTFQICITYNVIIYINWPLKRQNNLVGCFFLNKAYSHITLLEGVRKKEDSKCRSHLKILLMRTLCTLNEIFVGSILRRLIRNALMSYFPIQWAKTSWPLLYFQWKGSQKILHCSFPYLFNKSSSVRLAAHWTALKGVTINWESPEHTEYGMALSLVTITSAKLASLARVRILSDYNQQSSMNFWQPFLTNGQTTEKTALRCNYH